MGVQIFVLGNVEMNALMNWSVTQANAFLTCLDGS